MSFPQSISDILPKVLRQMGLAQRVKEAEIVRDWSIIVGETVARHCQPVTLDKGWLTVNVDSSPWLNELQRFSKGLILQKLQERLGKSAVRDMRFRIGQINSNNQNTITK